MEDEQGFMTEAPKEDDGRKQCCKSKRWEEVDSNDGDRFFLDLDGRVPFGGKVDFGFRSAPAALAKALSCPKALTSIVRDCQAVFTARAKKLEYSTGETFWMQADAEPRNSLETLALDIFRAHTGEARFDRAKSGAEWWSQVIDDEDDIGWHWDKDYGMEPMGINVHPCVATVTYLSPSGGPTVVLNKRGPMACEDAGGVSGTASLAWMSMPSLGKHMSFDGRYLHAAPAELAPPGPPCDGGNPALGASSSDAAAAVSIKRDQSGRPKAAAPAVGAAGRESSQANRRRKRVTFLVNVWLNHVPKSAAPLSEATARGLRSGRLDLDLSPAAFVPPKTLRVVASDGRVSDLRSAANGTSGAAGVSPGRGDEQSERSDREGICGSPKAVPRAESADQAARSPNGGVSEGEPAVDMRWEFGEVGEQAEEQVHLRHEVVIPVPVRFAGGEASPARIGGESFRVEFPPSRKPRVSRVGGDDVLSSEEESESDDDDDDDEGGDIGEDVDDDDDEGEEDDEDGGEED